ncbi:MAG: HD domain-containing protein [Chloroflexota bacterium]
MTTNTQTQPLSSPAYLRPDDRERVIKGARDLLTRFPDRQLRQRIADIRDLLMEWHIEAEYLLAGICLPLVDYVDTDKLTEAASSFGEDVARLVLRINGFQPAGLRDRQFQPFMMTWLRNLYHGMHVEPQIVLVALANHLISLGQLDTMDDAQRKRWATASIHVFRPICVRFGLLTYGDALTSIPLRILDRQRYLSLETAVAKYQERFKADFLQVKQQFDSELALYNIRHVELVLHVSSTLEVVKSNDQLPEHMIIDVLCNSVERCYRLLFVVHMLWSPRVAFGGRAALVDQISRPESNGYQYLRTVVDVQTHKGQPSRPVEFRIRTYDMDDINQYGIVAMRRRNDTTSPAWWHDRNLLDAVRKAYGDPNRLVIYSKDGRPLVSLSKGGTALDVSFYIHTALAPFTHKILVNNRAVPHDHELQTGDMVEVIFDLDQMSLHESWSGIVTSSRARRALKKAMRKRSQARSRGQRQLDEIFQREMRIYRLRLDARRRHQALRAAMTRLGYDDVDELYQGIANGVVAPDEVVMLMLEHEILPHIVLKNGERWSQDQMRIARSWVQERGSAKWDRVLRVIPGEPIVGHIVGSEYGRRLIVHNEASKHAPKGTAAIPLRWDVSDDESEALHIQVTAQPGERVVTTVLKHIERPDGGSATQVNLLQCATNLSDGHLEINCTVGIRDLNLEEQIDTSLNELRKTHRILNYTIWRLFPGESRVIVSQSDRRRYNPYTLRQIRTAGMFFGREKEIERIKHTLLDGNAFIVLYGQKRIGKTTLMHQLERLIPDETDFLPVMFDAHSVIPFTVDSFLYLLAESAYPLILTELQGGEDRRGLRLRQRDLAQNPFRVFANWVGIVEQRLNGTRLLFMIDEFTVAEELTRRGQLDRSFFDGLQWLAEKKQVGFLICVHRHIFRRDSLSYGFLQRGTPLGLEELDEDAASRLVRTPMANRFDIADETVARIIRLTNRHPYYIQALCQQIFNYYRGVGRCHVDDEAVNHSLADVLKSGDHYFAHLYDRIDDYPFTVLKSIAFLARHDNSWVDREAIQQEVAPEKHMQDCKQLSQTLYHLHEDKIIEGENIQGMVCYRILIPLFQMWLRQRTHPFVSHDMLQDR